MEILLVHDIRSKTVASVQEWKKSKLDENHFFHLPFLGPIDEISEDKTPKEIESLKMQIDRWRKLYDIKKVLFFRKENKSSLVNCFSKKFPTLCFEVVDQF